MTSKLIVNEDEEVVFTTEHYVVVILASETADAERCIYTDGWGRYQEAYAVVNRHTGVVEHLAVKYPEAALTCVGLDRAYRMAPWNAVEEQDAAPPDPALFGPLN